ncbi:phospholipid/cholesterol/gamma-HCH transport system ATP-binding protein [Desulfocicer vacuolatum DSM 3385]|uniref:Phospholipid/cholesterol/gamma-HCH transport system ATP-binding protein n=1 Tax=Desulfocicer vacuolatum DSM 3385 TaxID=1121400 RepID=A0A1W2CBL0_9BACT|nr:ATP-binding cassette domain-containing protein [Desulfocicer vacuolatum]SMC82549.1 phospholipid/cholesterol/gamma-HCH transport system ATP-binding protein [Desulfocicer vacuolatum DSM 3385]
MKTPIIEFKNVVKRFGDKTVLDGVSFTLNEGEITTIIGKSGTGKSVMLKHLIGLMRPDSGTLFYKGRDIATLKGKKRKKYMGQMSYMFQGNALFDSMTVFENVAFPLEQNTRLKKEEIKRRVMEILEKTDLADMAGRFPSELSGGMQKRVAFSRALITDPAIVFFDEPTTGQDLIRRNAILSMIADYKTRFNFTAVIISHDLPDVLFISNRVLVLHEGKIVFQGTPDAFEEFEHPYVDEFVHSLEGFQKHMPGIYSKRNFKMRYKNALRLKPAEASYVVAIFSISDFKNLCKTVGYTTAHAMVKELGMIISRHFDVVGGFSTRQRRSRFMTVLPFSNYKESREIIDAFVADLVENGFEYVKIQNSDNKMLDTPVYKIKVMTGLAEGVAIKDGINDVLEKARNNQFKIGDFQCVAGRCSL